MNYQPLKTKGLTTGEAMLEVENGGGEIEAASGCDVITHQEGVLRFPRHQRLPMLLTPTQVRLRIFGGKPARSCANSQYVCAQLEECDGDHVCREHGVFLTRPGTGRLLARCNECRACGTHERRNGRGYVEGDRVCDGVLRKR